MAGSALPAIDVVDLSRVCGGVDKQTSAAQTAIAQATAAMEDIAQLVAPSKDQGMLATMLSMMPPPRRRGPAPTPAPALPPTSTLTR